MASNFSGEDHFSGPEIAKILGDLDRLGRGERGMPDWLYSFLQSWKTVLIAAAILVATEFLKSFVGKADDDAYSFIKTLLNP